MVNFSISNLRKKVQGIVLAWGSRTRLAEWLSARAARGRNCRIAATGRKALKPQMNADKNGRKRLSQKTAATGRQRWCKEATLRSFRPTRAGLKDDRPPGWAADEGKDCGDRSLSCGDQTKEPAGRRRYENRARPRRKIAWDQLWSCEQNQDDGAEARRYEGNGD